MADTESKTIESLTLAAKAALLEAITTAAGTTTGTEPLEALARAFATVATSGPNRGELPE